ERGVRPVQQIALHLIVARLSALELRVLAPARRRVELLQRGLEPGSIDAAGRRQLGDSSPSLEIARADGGADREGKWLDRSQPPASLGAVVSDQPTLGLFACWCCLQQRGGEIVVAIGFIDEALTLRG